MTTALTLQNPDHLTELEHALGTLPGGMGRHTPQGCSIRFARFASKSLAYLAEDQIWIAFDGWRWDSTRGATIAELLYQEWLRDELRLLAVDFTKEAIEAAARLASGKARREILDLAKPKLAVSREAFDRGAEDLLVTPSGTVDLRTGAFASNDPARLLTQCTSVSYDPAAVGQCPNFANLVSKLAGDDLDTARWLWRAIGYSLTGRVSEDCLFFLRGDGANGKSTLTTTLLGLLGDYGHKIALTAITEGADFHATELAALKGRRFVTSSEVAKGQRLRESIVKDLSGGDLITARDMYQSAKAAPTWRPQSKLWLFGNHDLQIRGTDNGIWRRVRKVASTHTFARSAMRDGLLADEGTAILATAVAAAGEWYRAGLGVDPTGVAAATAAYRREQDHLGQFFDDALLFEPGATTPAAAVTVAYRAWCLEAGQDYPAGPKELAERLRARGAEQRRVGAGHSRCRSWVGVRINPGGG